jgi:hypothetical protein
MRYEILPETLIQSIGIILFFKGMPQYQTPVIIQWQIPVFKTKKVFLPFYIGILMG